MLCSSLLLNLIDFFVFGESHVCLFVCVCVVPNDQESMTHFVISICSLLPCGGGFQSESKLLPESTMLKGYPPP